VVVLLVSIMRRNTNHLKKSCTCIIPFFNENERLLSVLQVISQVRGVRQIVCVDDGSEKDISLQIKRQFPKVQVIRSEINKGKADAISQGLKIAKEEYVLLLDADLRFLKLKEIETAVRKVMENSIIDMLILRRVNAPTQVKLNRGDTMFSGERILKRSDLEKVIQERKPDRFEIEIAINQYMIDNHKTVYWMPSSALNTYKILKRGFLSGIAEDIPLILHFAKYIGISNYLRQIFSFCRKEAI